MNEQAQLLVVALREELEQCGEMLALLDQQQELVVRRDTGKLLENLAAINAQTSVIQVARQQREQRQHELNALLGLPANAAFCELLPRLTDEYRLLVGALVAEVNQCLYRVQQRTRQNHLLLSRSVEMIQRFVATLFPANGVTTYAADGRVATAGSSGLCEVTA
jgi:flagellar biosynthesis/type III secretory pathway chaperone